MSKTSMYLGREAGINCFADGFVFVAFQRSSNLELTESDLKSSLDGKNKELNQSVLLISQVNCTD